MKGTEESVAPGRTETVRVFGVAYTHIRCRNLDDLYLTEFGLPFLQSLLPENWFLDRPWFRQNAVRLTGSSSIFRVRTKPVLDRQIDFVLKWNRMGQEIPGGEDRDDFLNWRFNSPFEEFALLLEMRGAKYESRGGLYTHRPLGIYVPAERKDLDRLGRREYKMLAILELHREIELDMLRSYGVIYEWVKGIDAVEAADRGSLSLKEIADLTLDAERRMREKGFLVCDRKPHHLIVRPKGSGSLAKDRRGQVLYALVDFELLQRTAEREAEIRRRKEGQFMTLLAQRFKDQAKDLPPHVAQVAIWGVDYVHGNVESTKGKLWVVGRDAGLFDYFLAERWEVTPRMKVSATREVYHTVTKDDVHLVWNVSNVGVEPDADPVDEQGRKILAFGYNSPFEEVALALYLRSRGVSTLNPLAVYMAGHRRELAPYLFHESRYIRHRHLLNPDGTPLLREDRSYITIWGSWNQVEVELDGEEEAFYERMSALRAYRKRLVSKAEYVDLMRIIRQRLREVEVEDLTLRGTHILVPLDGRGRLIRGADGVPKWKLCSFELLRRLQTQESGPDTSGSGAPARSCFG